MHFKMVLQNQVYGDETTHCYSLFNVLAVVGATEYRIPVPISFWNLRSPEKTYSTVFISDHLQQAYSIPYSMCLDSYRVKDFSSGSNLFTILRL